jgi:predicted signal transduction protein with EAL and GGDEF domain
MLVSAYRCNTMTSMPSSWARRIAARTTVAAEGVETEAQANFLLSTGCAYGQGYYFSRPVNAERATELLRRGVIKPARDLLRVIETTGRVKGPAQLQGY